MKVALRKETGDWESAVKNSLALSNLLKFVVNVLVLWHCRPFFPGLPYEVQRSEAKASIFDDPQQNFISLTASKMQES
jgi:hypothetical protein